MFETDDNPGVDSADDALDDDRNSAAPTYGGFDTPAEFEEQELPSYANGLEPAAGGGEFREHWFEQAQNGTCVPASVAQIVSEYSGLEVTTEAAFVDYAVSVGLYGDGGIEGGMTAEAAVELLAAADVPAHAAAGTLDSLESAVEGGYGVMIAVDSGEYWYPTDEAVEEASGQDVGADHCVVISEVDQDAGLVYLSDPGTPDGNQLAVPIEQFEQAWAESGNTMIVCDEPSPNLDGQSFLDGPSVDAVGWQTPQGTPSAPPPPGFEDLADRVATSVGTSDPLSATVDWVTDRPWIVIPVALAGVAALFPRSQR